MVPLTASLRRHARLFTGWQVAFPVAVLLGTVGGASAQKRPNPPRVPVKLEALEVYTDGTKALVPANITTAGQGDRPIVESDQDKLSAAPKRLTALARPPGSKLWLIFNWQGHVETRLINPWPQSTLTYTVEFNLHRPNPHTVRHKGTR